MSTLPDRYFGSHNTPRHLFVVHRQLFCNCWSNYVYSLRANATNGHSYENAIMKELSNEASLSFVTFVWCVSFAIGEWMDTKCIDKWLDTFETGCANSTLTFIDCCWTIYFEEYSRKCETRSRQQGLRRWAWIAPSTNNGGLWSDALSDAACSTGSTAARRLRDRPVTLGRDMAGCAGR